jgi:hypothetical protein
VRQTLVDHTSVHILALISMEIVLTRSGAGIQIKQLCIRRALHYVSESVLLRLNRVALRPDRNSLKKSDTSTRQFVGTFTEPAYISSHRFSLRIVMYRYKQFLYISTLSVINKLNS